MWRVACSRSPTPAFALPVPARVGAQHSVQAPAPLWSPASSHVHLAQGLGSWGRPGFSLPSPCCCGHLGSQPVGERFLSVSLPFTSNKQGAQFSLPASLPLPAPNCTLASHGTQRRLHGFLWGPLFCRRHQCRNYRHPNAQMRKWSPERLSHLSTATQMPAAELGFDPTPTGLCSSSGLAHRRP